MIKLLHSGLSRLWKSIIFWASVSAVLCCTLWSITQFNSLDLKSPDILLVIDTPFCVVAVICIAVWVGKDHRDHTIRNKLIIGHGRVAVYLSNVIVCSIAAGLLYIERILIVRIIAVAIHGAFSQSGAEELAVIAANFMCVFAFTAVCVLLAMLITDMTVSTVTAVLLTVAMSYASLWITLKLEQEEYIKKQTVRDGQSVWITVKSPDYITQPMRTGYMLADGLLPNGQMYQITAAVRGRTIKSKYTMVEIYQLERETGMGEIIQMSFAVMLASTACGVFAFRRKNLK